MARNLTGGTIVSSAAVVEWIVGLEGEVVAVVARWRVEGRAEGRCAALCAVVSLFSMKCSVCDTVAPKGVGNAPDCRVFNEGGGDVPKANV